MSRTKGTGASDFDLATLVASVQYLIQSGACRSEREAIRHLTQHQWTWSERARKGHAVAQRYSGHPPDSLAHLFTQAKLKNARGRATDRAPAHARNRAPVEALRQKYIAAKKRRDLAPDVAFWLAWRLHVDAHTAAVRQSARAAAEQQHAPPHYALAGDAFRRASAAREASIKLAVDAAEDALDLVAEFSAFAQARSPLTATERRGLSRLPQIGGASKRDR